MKVSYDKLWKLLIDRKVSAAELRKETSMAPNTLTKLRKNEVVSMTVLMSICGYLNCDIGDICEFVQEFLSYKTVDGKVVATTIPESVEEIQPYAFSSLEEMQSVILPQSVKKVGSWAFYWCSALRSMILPDSVTELGDGVFHRCSTLEAVHLPPNIKRIRRDLFHMCSALRSVNIPEGVTEIGDNAFSLCHSLTTLTLPDSLCTIGEAAFSGCRGLMALRIPEQVVSIGSHAFDWCNSLTAIHIPAAVAFIGDCAFADCDNLETITVATENGNYCDLDGVLYTADGEELLAYPKARGMTGYDVDTRTTKIREGAFRDCYDLIHVVLPDSVQQIGAGAFWCCNSLKTLELPDTIQRIEKEAFWGCRNLTVSVRSVETGKILYKIWMGMDGEVMEQRNILAGAWNGKQGYHFAELDCYFPEMKRMENRIMTALTRVEYPEQLSKESRQMYLAFLEQEAVAVGKRMIDLDDLELLIRFEQYGFFTQEKLKAVLSYARIKQAVPFLAHLINYQNEQFGHVRSKLEL